MDSRKHSPSGLSAQIRSAETADAGVISGLRQQFWLDQIAKGAIDHPKLENFLADTMAMFKRPRTHMFVAAHGDKIVGYLFGQSRVIPSAVSSIVSSIEEIFVVPEHRGNCLANNLVMEALAAFRAAGAHRFQLRVLERNDNAKLFWPTLNFFPSVTIYEYSEKTGQDK